MILNERESRHEHVLHVARQMMTAARTAPKGKGVDIIEIAMVTDGDINILSEMMVKMVAEHLSLIHISEPTRPRCGKYSECGMCPVNRYPRTGARIELWSLWICHLRVSQRRSAVCSQ